MRTPENFILCMNKKNKNTDMKENAQKTLQQAMKETVCFFSRGNIFLQIGKILTEKEIEEERQQAIRFDFSAL